MAEEYDDTYPDGIEPDPDDPALDDFTAAMEGEPPITRVEMDREKMHTIQGDLAEVLTVIGTAYDPHYLEVLGPMANLMVALCDTWLSHCPAEVFAANQAVAVQLGHLIIEKIAEIRPGAKALQESETKGQAH